MKVKTVKHRALLAIRSGGQPVGGAEFSGGYWWSFRENALTAHNGLRHSTKRAAIRWLLLNIEGCQVNELCAIHTGGAQ